MFGCGRRAMSLHAKAFSIHETSGLVVAKSLSTSSFYHTKKFDGALPLSEIPGPVRVPIVGNILQFEKAGGIGNFHEALNIMRKEYGKIFQLKFGPERLVCISDVDMIEDVYRNEGKYPGREKSFPAWDKYHKKHNLPKGVFFEEGEEWLRHRNALSPKLLNIKQVEHYAPDFNKVIDGLMRKVMSSRSKNMEVEHIEKELFKWSIESVCTVLLETHLGCFSSHPDPKYEEFIAAVNNLLQLILELMFNSPVVDKIIETKPIKEFNAAMDVIYKVAEDEIDEKLKRFKEQHGNKIDDETPKEFIPYLYYVQEMSLADIKSDISSLMMAAVETTSTSMQVLLFNLATNQQAQSKLHEEIANFMEPGEPATVEMLKRMPFLKAVIKESMRLHPVAPFNARWFIDDKCVAGYNIPAKTLIILMHETPSRDENVFEDAEKFKPERWLRDERGEHKIHPFASLPFGFGTRMCLGRRLADLQIQLLTSRIFGKYMVECDHKMMKMVSGGTLNKPNVDLKFRIYER
ncbi:1,25-dihydroxyvitamin D(3) 24-hydroxylase, mitochondrial-like [Rhopilema esculentum]|uniref:1,25-dihydroxyvitamin D(3) 24-hydroxylase, mitochondrial-like n=1 Tax=Rhopilema esculentum TaxID=499914 RepID=UPI0031D93417